MTATSEEAVNIVAQMMANQPQPLYLRNWAVTLRRLGVEPEAYGFANWLTLLQACKRAKVLRVTRDRQGGMRIERMKG